MTNNVKHSTMKRLAGIILSVMLVFALAMTAGCEGGGNPAVVLSVVNAVRNVTGISSDRISVMKMITMVQYIDVFMELCI